MYELAAKATIVLNKWYYILEGGEAALPWRITHLPLGIEAIRLVRPDRFICAKLKGKSDVGIFVKEVIRVEEQLDTMNQLNEFLNRRGLKANFVARQLGISEGVIYGFKTGARFLTQRQLQKLRDFIEEYDCRLGDCSNS